MILTLPVILILAISTYVFFDRHWERMTGRLAVSVSGEVAFLAEQVSKDPSAENIDMLTQDSTKYLQLNIKYVPEGKIRPDPIRYQGRSHLIKKMLAPELKYRLNHPFRILVDTEEKWIQVQVQLEEGALIVTSPERRLFFFFRICFYSLDDWYICNLNDCRHLIYAKSNTSY